MGEETEQNFVAGVSEFGLPTQMRSLLVRLYNELLVPGAEGKELLKNQVAEARRTLNSAEEKNQVMRTAAKTGLDQAKAVQTKIDSEIERFRARIQCASVRIEVCCNEHKVKFPAPTSVKIADYERATVPASDPNRSIRAQKLITEVEAVNGTVARIKPFGNAIWPKDDDAKLIARTAGVIGGLVITLILWIASAVSCGAVIFVIPLTYLCITVIMATHRQSLVSTAVSPFGSAFAKADSFLTQWQHHAIADYAAAEATFLQQQAEIDKTSRDLQAALESECASHRDTLRSSPFLSVNTAV